MPEKSDGMRLMYFARISTLDDVDSCFDDLFEGYSNGLWKVVDVLERGLQSRHVLPSVGSDEGRSFQGVYDEVRDLFNKPNNNYRVFPVEVLAYSCHTSRRKDLSTLVQTKDHGISG